MRVHEAWLAKALSDLKIAKKGIKDDDETLDTAVYHTQQCVEKSLKAYIIFCGKLFPKTHDLERLLEACCQIDSSFVQLKTIVLDLTPYATYSRYPDDWFSVDRQEVEDAIERAEKVMNFVKKMIENKLHPNTRIF